MKQAEVQQWVKAPFIRHDPRNSVATLDFSFLSHDIVCVGRDAFTNRRGPLTAAEFLLSALHLFRAAVENLHPQLFELLAQLVEVAGGLWLFLFVRERGGDQTTSL